MNITTVTMTVNHRKISRDVPAAMRLSDFLRETLYLTGTKTGCGAGECGTCTVLIDGELKKTCLMPVLKAEGAEILTIEGLGADGVTTIQKAFMESGAVQCGYCTPGMIMTATRMLKDHPDISRDEIVRGFAGNICRCTGYQKIFDAVELARDVLKGDREFSGKPDAGPSIGRRVPRIDARGKVTGDLRYAADLDSRDMHHIQIVRSPHPHAAILSLDFTAALDMPGVVTVLTCDDVPGEDGFGVYYNDQPVLAREKVRFVGEPVAAVVAETLEQARRAAALVDVRYEELPVVSTIEQALDDGAPQLHTEWAGNVVSTTKVNKGNVDKGLKEADFIVRETYTTAAVEHAYLETEAGYAYVDSEGVVTVCSSDQDITHHRLLLTRLLGLPVSKIRVIQTPVGGGFGGKEDLLYQGILAIGAMKTGKPVKIVYTREESFINSAKRHPMVVTHEVGITRDGRLTAAKIDIKADGGAYCFSTKGIVGKAAIVAAGPYSVPNLDVVSTGVYTNNTPSGAMRSFGTIQPQFAIEATMDRCSEVTGIDPFELREINALKDGDETHTRQKLGKVSLSSVLSECRTFSRWEKGPSCSRGSQRQDLDGSGCRKPYNPADPHKTPESLAYMATRERRGRGVSAAWYGIGRSATPDRASAWAELDDGGTLKVATGVTEIGEGILTVLAQIAADELGINPGDVVIGDNDTARAPEAAHAGASRQTYMVGNAVKRACAEVRQKLIDQIALHWNIEGDHIQTREGRIFVEGFTQYSMTIAEAVHLLKFGKGVVIVGSGSFTSHHTPLDSRDGSGMPWQAYVFGSQVAEVSVNTSTGEITVLGLWAVHDVGRAINPQGVEGQIEGGAVQGLGQALMEDYQLSDGIPQTVDFTKYTLPTSVDVPMMNSLILEEPDPLSPLGAKGIGEPAPIPTPPAIINAVYDAVGIRITSLPATPDKVLTLIENKAKEDRS